MSTLCNERTAAVSVNEGSGSNVALFFERQDSETNVMHRITS